MNIEFIEEYLESILNNAIDSLTTDLKKAIFVCDSFKSGDNEEALKTYRECMEYLSNLRVNITSVSEDGERSKDIYDPTIYTLVNEVLKLQEEGLKSEKEKDELADREKDKLDDREEIKEANTEEEFTVNEIIEPKFKKPTPPATSFVAESEKKNCSNFYQFAAKKDVMKTLASAMVEDTEENN